jgi:hypothetical protein
VYGVGRRRMLGLEGCRRRRLMLMGVERTFWLWVRLLTVMSVRRFTDVNRWLGLDWLLRKRADFLLKRLD